ncbi:MAG: hypothetical protein K2O01_02930, partial [Bacteroidales bacterium]|nr:hypothetical protein [Bacteroidales bacterium]
MKIVAGIVWTGLLLGGCPVRAGEVAPASVPAFVVMSDTLGGETGSVQADTVALADTVVAGETDLQPTAAENGFRHTKNTPQRLMIDQIVAVIGTKMVKLSDVEKTVESIRMGGTLVSDEIRCNALETMLISNLYALQADEDSVSIGENQIEGELEARLAYFIEQIGSREKLDEFYGKTIVQI